MHSLQFPDSSAHRPSVLKFKRQPLVELPHPRQQIFRSRHKSLHRCLGGSAFGKHQRMKFLKKLGQSTAFAKIQRGPVRCRGARQRISRPKLNPIFEHVVDSRKAQPWWLRYRAVQERDTRVPVANQHQ